MRGNDPEDHLLLCCGTLYGGREKAERINALLAGEMDWPVLLQTARLHGVLPLLYCNLREVSPERIPAPVREALRNDFRSNTVHNLILTDQLLKILDLFQGQGIQLIPYKGPTLDAIAYQEKSLRQFCDLDFIIHRGDVLKAKELLLAQGYRPEAAFSPAEEAAHLQHECEYNFYHEDAGVLVELHWDVLPKYFACHFDSNELWSQLEPVMLFGKEVLTFSPSKLLLVLCLHNGGKHQWERLGWISDVAQLINTQRDMDWEWVMGRAARAGIERMVLLGLYLAKTLPTADLPDFVESKLQQDRSLEALAAEVWARLFSRDGRPGGEIEQLAFYLKMRERPSDKFRYLARRLFTPTINDRSVVQLPPRFYPLYRLIRPFRLARECAGKGLVKA